MPRLLRLRAGERFDLVRALFAVAGVRLGLSLFSYARLRAWTGGAPARRPGDIGQLRRVAWSVTAASRLVPRATCLTQAVAGQLLLRRRGISSTVEIGVERNTGDALKAHAWLVSDGMVVLGGPAGKMAGYHRIVGIEG